MNQKPNIQNEHELTPLDAAGFTEGKVPKRVRIAPWGQVDSTRGRFVVDDESATLTQKAFAEHGTDLPVDYEHQTLGGEFAAPNGQAPAAGWITAIVAEPGVGLFADVRWTDRAKKLLANREYRYLSPVALVRRTDRKLIGLHSVALTNKPAIVGADPIVNRDGQVRVTIAALCDRLQLAPTSDTETLLVAAAARLEELDRERTHAAAEQKVSDATRSGRIVPAQRDFALKLALKDPEMFDEWIAAAPVVVPLGHTAPPDAGALERPRRALAARAAAEFRTHPELAAITNENAYIADALRNHASR